MHESPVIETRGLTKSYRSAVALAGLDLSVPAATTMCLLGPNGAGKTTAVRILATLLRPDRGWARVAGYDVVTHGAAVRRRIGLSGQDASLDECLTGRANLVMIGELSRLRRSEAKRRAAELIGRFGLQDAAGRAVRTYSGGMRRRLDLAASLLCKPSVLFLDEPTTGLDPHSRQTVWDSIRDLVDGGTTVLLTTQYLEEADRLADRICVVDKGRVIAEGAPAQLKESLGIVWLRLTIPAHAAPAHAAAVLAAYAVGPVQHRAAAGELEMPVRSSPGLVTQVVRALDAEGIVVDDIAVRRPSLDEVYHALTAGPAV